MDAKTCLEQLREGINSLIGDLSEDIHITRVFAGQPSWPARLLGSYDSKLAGKVAGLELARDRLRVVLDLMAPSDWECVPSLVEREAQAAALLREIEEEKMKSHAKISELERRLAFAKGGVGACN